MIGVVFCVNVTFNKILLKKIPAGGAWVAQYCSI